MNVTTADNGDGIILAGGVFSVQPGVTNYVVFDGVEYMCEPRYSAEVEDIAIGSLDFSDYPFFITGGLIITETAGNHTVLQYCDVYTVHADYAPCLVIRTRKKEDKTPYLAMEDVEKIKAAFENGVPIMLDTGLRNMSITARVHNVDGGNIYSYGFGYAVTNVIEQMELIFSTRDGSLETTAISHLGSIYTNGDYYPLMYINNRRYKITVDDSGTLKATEVTA